MEAYKEGSKFGSDLTRNDYKRPNFSRLVHSIQLKIRHNTVGFLPSANKVWGKVIFLHLFVILFTGGVGVCLSACWNTTHTPPRPAPPPGTRHPKSRQPPLGADIPPGADTPPGPGTPRAEHSGRYGEWAGGTHPTGMQQNLAEMSFHWHFGIYFHVFKVIYQ